MANFKTALEMLAKGDIDVVTLSKQLATLLEQTPQYASSMLQQLEKAYEKGSIDDQSYTTLKRQINQYRRSHSAETESADTLDDSAMTVFEQSDQLPTNSADNEAEISSDDDATQLMDDQTQLLADDSTQLMPPDDNDKTQMLATGAEDSDVASFDITGATDLSDVAIDISSTAGTGWASATEEPPVQTAFGPGSIIKQRFKLLEVLGIGGMGKVYKGIDLLKEEAKDKKPHIAIKLLNEDFKDHPEAFISLQRESSRQQKLAHPNIATIYDFDRVGGKGTPVFITMELMEGMELKDYIKKNVRKQGGLPFDEAFIIIEQLVAGLAYAHERRLVHSDFKPGNCFLCNDGTVKTLDFGIARAVKNPVTGEAEKTLFDPGQLGALTPAYASLEMLEGEEPDTRDDTYALGCVAYELLTGKHPFDKLPANKAKANNLKPLIVKGIKKKQNLALQRSIAFLRKDRSPTVNHFLTELKAEYIWYKHPLTIAAILLVAASLGGTVPILNYYHQKQIEQFIVTINSGDSQTVAQQLTLINGLEQSDQRTIRNDAKVALQGYFRDKITKLTDVLNDDYNFLQATLVLAEAKQLYPDSNFIKEQTEYISTAKKQQLGKLHAEFSDALAQAKEQNDASALDNVNAILDTIKTRIDPNDSLLTDARASNRYRLLASNALDLGTYEEALKLISAGLVLAPQDDQLVDTKTAIERAIDISAIESKLGAIRTQLSSLEDYQQIKDDIIGLTRLDSTNSILLPLAASLQEIVAEELSNIVTNGGQSDAQTFADEYSSLLSALQLNKELIDIKLAHLSGSSRTEVMQEIASTNLSIITQSVQSPMIDNVEWESNTLASIRELNSLADIDATVTAAFAGELANLRHSIAEIYLAEAQKALDLKRFDTSKNLITRGKLFAPEDSGLLNIENAVAQAEADNEKQILVDGLIKDFKAQIAAHQINKAIEYYDELKIELAENDGFITEEAPALLSSSYAYLADNSFTEQDFISALKFADQGLEFNPNNRLLKAARAEYVIATNIIELTEQFNNSISFDLADVQRKIGEISSSIKFTEFRQTSIATLEKRINALKTSNENAAARLAQDGAIFFPGSSLNDLAKELQIQPWPDASIARATLNKGELTLAKTLLQKAIVEFPDHPEVDEFNKTLQASLDNANESFSQYISKKQQAGNDYETLRSIKRSLLRAQSLWIDNPDYNTAETELDELIAANKPVSKKVMVRENIDLSTGEQEVVVAEWQPIESGRTCGKRLAGYGKRAKAVCYDFINNGWRGPLMVVLPTGNEFSNHFAISKYEISVGDYGKYCAISKSCTPEKNKDKFNDPMTRISLTEAKAYVQWMTERTGKIYRLPTKNEWEYAANADGQQPRKDYNCRVALGDKIVKGTGITSVKSGPSNGWGLKNYIGNVQEWVIDNNETTAKGGAFQDAHSKCSISFSREHDGRPDEQTGFRIVLEDVGSG